MSDLRLVRDGLATGLHHGIPMADYVADPCVEPSLSASAIRNLVELSPLKAWQSHPRLGGKANYSKASDAGSASHALVLEGTSIIKVIAEAETAKGDKVVPKDWRLASTKAARDKIRASGKIPLLQHEAAEVYAMAKVAGEAIQEAVGDGDAEVTIIWQEKNGIWCRARADYLAKPRDKPVVDYKTTKKSSNPAEWIRRSLFTDGYDVSAAWYLRGLEALGEARPEYRFLVQEQNKPYDYGWVGLEEHCEAIHQIQPWIKKAIKVWGECLKSGNWPGYPKHVFYADAAAWRAIQIEESQLADELSRDFGGEE